MLVNAGARTSSPSGWPPSHVSASASASIHVLAPRQRRRQLANAGDERRQHDRDDGDEQADDREHRHERRETARQDGVEAVDEWQDRVGDDGAHEERHERRPGPRGDGEHDEPGTHGQSGAGERGRRHGLETPSEAGPLRSGPGDRGDLIVLGHLLLSALLDRVTVTNPVPPSITREG